MGGASARCVGCHRGVGGASHGRHRGERGASAQGQHRGVQGCHRGVGGASAPGQRRGVPGRRRGVGGAWEGRLRGAGGAFLSLSMRSVLSSSRHLLALVVWLVSFSTVSSNVVGLQTRPQQIAIFERREPAESSGGHARSGNMPSA